MLQKPSEPWKKGKKNVAKDGGKTGSIKKGETTWECDETRKTSIHEERIQRGAQKMG